MEKYAQKCLSFEFIEFSSAPKAFSLLSLEAFIPFQLYFGFCNTF